MKKITLIIEKSHDGLFWGRIKYKNNLLVEKASSVVALERKMKKLLSDFYDLQKEKIEFEIAYDLSVFFEQKDFLNISGIAKLANINASLLRQYAAGIKFPSPEKAAEIEDVMCRIGNERSLVNISARVREGEEKRNKMDKVSIR